MKMLLGLSLQEGILLVVLGICTWQDLRRKQIYIPVPAAGIAAGIVLALSGSSDPADTIAGIGIGAALLVLSRLTRDAVGSGDGWMTAACGSLIGRMQTLILLMTALFLLGTVSAVLTAAHRKKRTDTVAFAPFLLAAYILTSVLLQAQEGG